jgi:hypothetical protein
MMRIGVSLVAVLLFAGSSKTVSAQDTNAPRMVLVELFTSEGCSSCPPADALLRKLNGTRSDSGQIIVGLSEHVTYWNNLGWMDPFSDETYTSRQSAYGEHFRLDSVYTPQVVVNGEAQVLGSDGSAILKAVAKTGDRGQVVVHIDSVSASDVGSRKTVAVTFSVAGLAANGADIYAVIADDMASSSVLRGENTGRTLSHVSVARSLPKVASLKEAKTLTVSLPVPLVLKGQPETKRHLIVFAQERGAGKVLAVQSQAL